MRLSNILQQAAVNKGTSMTMYKITTIHDITYTGCLPEDSTWYKIAVPCSPVLVPLVPDGKKGWITEFEKANLKGEQS